jgi:hypothetical protein
MDKDQFLTIFNKQFKEFVEDICRVFPENQDLLTLKLTISKILTITPKIIYSGYKKHLIDLYRNQIETGDISFFIDKDYKGDLNKLGASNNVILDKIDSLREPVRNMGPTEQAKVVKYMQNMMKLSDMYEYQ